MFFEHSDLTKRCEGHDVVVERNYDLRCEFDACPTLGINPASVGDSYRGAGVCWDFPTWIGVDNSVNRAIIQTNGLEPNYYPKCWWFGPDHTMDYTTLTNEPDCLSLHTDEDAQLACFCRHNVWDVGTIADSRGKTMMQACCACGGGTSWDPDDGPPTPPPTEGPTVPPTVAATKFVLPDGALVSTIRYKEAFFEEAVHWSSEFYHIIKRAIAYELEVTTENIYIIDIRAGSVIIDFYVDQESVYTAEEKIGEISQRIFDATHTGINEKKYYGLSTSAVEVSSMSGTSSDSDSDSGSNTGRSVGIGVGVAAAVTIFCLAGYTAYQQRQKEAAASSRFIFRA